MHKVERILRDEGSNEAVVICGAGTFRITVHDLDVIDIEEGSQIDEDIITSLQEGSQRLSCIKKAFDFLSYGDLSERQLRDKLCRKFDKNLSEDVAALFVERGYVNDERLAERYAETFYEFKNMGIGKIKNELYRRGISREHIENAIAKYEDEDQAERIVEFINKKYDVEKMADEKYRRKVYAGAIRAGFSSSDVADVIRNFESE